MAAAPKRTQQEVRARRKLGKMLGRQPPDRLHCSFCGKSQVDVAKLIAGPWTFICDGCVRLCQGIIDGGPPPDPKGHFRPLDRPDDELLSLAGSVNYASENCRDFLQSVVDTLRKREVSWADIGQHLGVSRQSAWERFS